jgi:hypothetical protein
MELEEQKGETNRKQKKKKKIQTVVIKLYIVY